MFTPVKDELVWTDKVNLVKGEGNKGRKVRKGPCNESFRPAYCKNVYKASY